MKNNIRFTRINDLVELFPKPYSDNRGLFLSVYKEQETMFSNYWGSRKISQVNISRTNAVGSIRGLHFQLSPYSEAKLVRCIRGKIWDVAIDLRKNSDTFGCWYSTELCAELGNTLFIPEGFAHGFQVLCPNSELHYIHSKIWVKEAESGIRFDDPTLGINWPLEPKDISKRDLSLPFFNNLDNL